MAVQWEHRMFDMDETMRADATLLLLDKDTVEQLLTPAENLTVARLIYERACAQALGSGIGLPW